MADAAATKQSAALASIFASAFITLAKLAAGLMSGSLALVSEAGHAALDTGATILTFFAVRAADKPADEEHPYGHHKIESVAALVETGLLFVLAVGVLVEAARRLLGHMSEAVDANWLAFAVLIGSIAIDFVRWRGLTRVARETKSHALAADALHFSSDLVASVLVLIGLAATRLGFMQGDTFAALGVSGFIAVAGWKLGSRTIDALIDAAPKGLADEVREIVAGTEGVASITTLRLRPAGPNVIGELGIEVPRTMPFEEVARLKSKLGRAIAEAIPDNDITITANPRALDHETLLERVLLVAARRRLTIHHVTIQEISGRKSVSLDVELDSRMSLGLAHEIASALESGIRAEAPGVEVETHIEPLETEEYEVQDAAPDIVAAIRDFLVVRAAEGGEVKEPHDVRVRTGARGLVVNYHCRIDPALAVEEAHDAVDQLDRKVRAAFPEVSRIVGHAEPLPR